MKNFLLLTTIYIAVLCFMGGIACFFSYQQKKSEVLLEMNMTFEKLELEYLNILDNFWQIYMPIFESVGDNYIHSLLTEYYIPEKNTTLSPLDKRELAAALNQMMLRDDQIKWIALYSEDREYNYILFQGSSNLNELTNNFPYLDQIASSPSYMSVWGTETITDSGTTFNTYAICGGVPANMGNGRIVVGYNITALEQICKNSTVPLASLNYRLTSDQDILFDSSGDYDENTGYIPTKNMTENIHLSDGAQVYVNSVISGNNTSVISYTVLWKELLRYFHVYTLPILLVVFLFCGVSLILYATMLRMITKEVNTIDFQQTLFGTFRS